ncbi:MAG: STAS domain-containing protein [Actinomycetota bacterium]
MQSSCDVTVRRIPGAVVLELRGELNAAATDLLLPTYREAVRDGNPQSVLLDFAQVDYINSTGIALVVGVLAQARAEGRTIVACGLSEHYREIFAITRLSDFMQMFGDVDAALVDISRA